MFARSASSPRTVVTASSCRYASSAWPAQRASSAFARASSASASGQVTRSARRWASAMAAALASASPSSQYSLGLSRSHLDDFVDGAEFGDDRGRQFIVLARGGELTARGDPVGQLGQRE